MDLTLNIMDLTLNSTQQHSTAKFLSNIFQFYAKKAKVYTVAAANKLRSIVTGAP